MSQINDHDIKTRKIYQKQHERISNNQDAFSRLKKMYDDAYMRTKKKYLNITSMV